MITRSLKTTTTTTSTTATSKNPSSLIQESKKKSSKKLPTSKNNGTVNDNHKAPVFDCDCFDCYTSYWFRWDSSPNRELIHQKGMTPSPQVEIQSRSGDKIQQQQTTHAAYPPPAVDRHLAAASHRCVSTITRRPTKRVRRSAAAATRVAAATTPRCRRPSLAAAPPHLAVPCSRLCRAAALLRHEAASGRPLKNPSRSVEVFKICSQTHLHRSQSRHRRHVLLGQQQPTPALPDGGAARRHEHLLKPPRYHESAALRRSWV
ncbi:hypothetical protein Tsubulata_030174 [Turnera subulata]|uniref:Uncharacterized protein n=1 Tax=Turnera subulata TaxID=218843 RepID=A0A9Q0F920_9ROSI|nr:hypothetical protein Tsubulata_030174 [Turnera subulata]